jgi:dipeptidyl aminopeptidase/acylaminoacyl peptidase
VQAATTGPGYSDTMDIPRPFLFLIILLALTPAGHAAEPLTPEQALGYLRIGDLQFSPDGTKLAFVVTSYRWDTLPKLRVMDLASGAVQELTPAGKSERSPQWSADGARLAFLSNRAGATQVYTLPANGGEPVAVTAHKPGVDAYHWSPDGKSLAYLAREEGNQDENAPQVADAESDLRRLWIIDASPGAAPRLLGKTGWGIDDFAWAGASDLLIAATDQPRAQAYTNVIYRITTAGGAVQAVSHPAQPWGGLVTSPDGREFAVRSTADAGPELRDLFTAKFSDGVLHQMQIPGNLGISDARWRAGDVLWVRVADGFFNRLWRFAPGAAPQRIDLERSVAAFDVARDGRIAFVGEDFTHLPEIFLREKNGTVRQLPQQQQGFEGVTLAPASIFRTRSPDGLSIEAALMQPTVPAAPGTRLPLVLRVHGGPASNFTASYSWESAWSQLLAAHGYQVLMVNPRGSTGYDSSFVKANRADLGGGDYRDLMLVLDAVIARGTTDPERLGIGGWSYGAEMSAWATTQTGRFKAAVVGAGVYDQQAEFETEAHPEADEWYFGVPWEHPEVFAHNSPLTYVGNDHTPTLIFCGTEDASNPVGQSIGLYRALKHLGTETQLVLYPHEGHSPRRGSYNVDMFKRLLDWYDVHLKPEPAAPSSH